MAKKPNYAAQIKTLKQQLEAANAKAKAPTDTLSYYTQQAQNTYAPKKAQAEKDMTARFANQGILSSTAAQGGINKAVEAVNAEANQYANQQWQWDVARRDTQKQQAITNAMNLYNLLQSGAIGQAAYKKNVKFPNQPSMFGSLYKTNASYPTAAMGPVGDPWPTTPTEMYSRQQANNDFSAQMQAQSEAAALERQKLSDAAAMERLRFQAENAATTSPTTDPWTEMSKIASDNQLAALSQDAQLHSLAKFPSTLLHDFQATYGVDVKQQAMKDAKEGRLDSKAIAVFANLYPATWKQQLGLEDKAASPLASAATPTPSGPTMKNALGQTISTEPGWWTKLMASYNRGSEDFAGQAPNL